MKLAAALLLLLVFACHKCPEDLVSKVTFEKKQWVPYATLQATQLINDSGGVLDVDVPYWFVDTLEASSTQDNFSCTILSQHLQANVTTNAPVNFNMELEFVFEHLKFSVPGYTTFLYFNDESGPGHNFETLRTDTVSELLNDFVLNGVLYGKTIHVNSFVGDDGIGVPEFYYAKRVGLIYLRPYGSAVAWKRY
jgi:hypothetical protein